MRGFGDKKGTARAILYSIPTGIMAVFILGRLYTIQGKTHLEETLKEKQAMEQTLRDITSQRDKLEEELKAIKPKLDDAMHSNIFAIKQELASLSEALTEKEKAILETRKEVGAAQLSAYLAKKELDETSQKIKTLRQRFIDNERSSSQSKIEASRFTEAIKNKQEYTLQLENENRAIKEETALQLARLEKERLSLQELLDKSQAQLSSQVALSVSIQERIVSLMQSLKEKNAGQDSLKKKLDEAVQNQLLLKKELDETAKSRDIELGRKAQQLLTLKEEMDGIFKEKLTVEAKLAETNERLKKIADEKTTLELNLSSFNQLLKESEAKAGLLRAEVDRMKTETVKIKDELLSAKERQQQTNEQLLQVVNINSSLQKKLVDLSNSLDISALSSITQNTYPAVSGVDPDKEEALELWKTLQKTLNVKE